MNGKTKPKILHIQSYIKSLAAEDIKNARKRVCKKSARKQEL